MTSSKNLIAFKPHTSALTEPEVEAFAAATLKKAGYMLTMRKCKNALLNKHWPSKTTKATGKGYPDILLYSGDQDKPLCVWENKSTSESVEDALSEAQFYIEGLREKLPNEPALPAIAVGYNGKELKINFYNSSAKWVSVKADGQELTRSFPVASLLSSGINSQGVFTATSGAATVHDLRNLFPKLKTLYRNIPVLSSGRAPVDFTVALLTLKLIVEQQTDWGSWNEIPRFSPGSKTIDHAIGERFKTLVERVFDDYKLKEKYSAIFAFHEKGGVTETAFAFADVLAEIPKGALHFSRMYLLLDDLAPLTNADFDIFGEVYQSIGDEATKKSLGEFFTGRHIIAGILPLLMHRSGLDASFDAVKTKKIGDIACGTGGFLTEILRLVERQHKLSDTVVRSFSRKAFYGYDLGVANASRARVNMYFAGDGFSDIRGGFDSLSSKVSAVFPVGGFDVIATNPPYGSSVYGRTEEKFLSQVIEKLRKGTGWGCIVLPTGVLENPRSSKIRFHLLNSAVITDVVSLPRHAFAPYTQQRTGILIFKKRSAPLVSESSDWKTLIAACQKERVSMFIVDNDGYANSDKRYPTDLKATNGQWLHNDLAQWLDAKGLKQKSKLIAAAVDEDSPIDQINEIGDALAEKHGIFTVGDLADEQRGIALLPDIKLRDAVRSIKTSLWLKRISDAVSFAKGEDIVLPMPFRTEIEFLLDHVPSLVVSDKPVSRQIKNLFDFTKGDTGLTEAVIYRYLDAQNGLPVYGGGAGAPRFRAKVGLLRTSGEAAKIFSGPAVIVSMDGSAGSIQIVEKGKFYCNHHGAVLVPKSKDANLHCFSQMVEPVLKRLSSNKGSSATLTRKVLENLSFKMPSEENSILKIQNGRKALTTLSRLIR